MNTTEQRRFSRIRFHSGATLLASDREAACEVLDLSLKGALLRLLGAFDVTLGERCLLELRLGDTDVVVRMEGEVAHREPGRIGLTCREIDLDSITHLRRLLELNLGDPVLLQREFSALISG